MNNPSQQVIQGTVYSVLLTVSFSHLLNDLMQSIIPSVYPVIKENYNFTFTQIGVITLVFQITASILQPFVGAYTDKRPKPFSLALAMVFTLFGILVLSQASQFYMFLVAVALIGLGSSIFHPEASRVAYLASGGRKGFAQSVFQLGGNIGSAIGPLLAAVFVITQGQGAIAWFGLVPILGMVILFQLGKWYRDHLIQRKNNPGTSFSDYANNLSKKRIRWSLFILLTLLFSKYFYMAGMTNYFTFYLIEKFQVSIQASQYYLFAFLFAIALGTIIGGPLGDRFGRKYVIWFSILGAAPFTLLLPYVGLFGAVSLAILIGFIMASAFSAILVYATDLIPGKIGMISGLFFGFMFGIAGIGSVVLGRLADLSGIDLMFKVCSYLPLIGIITVFLPDDAVLRRGRR